MMDIKKYKKFIMTYDEYISYNHKFQTFNEIIDKVNEGLIKTSLIDYTVRYVGMMLSKFKLDFNVSNDGNSLILSINQFNYIDLIRMKLTTIESMVVNQCGYFPARYNLYYIGGASKKDIVWSDDTWDYLCKNSEYYSKVELFFEAKFDDIVETESQFLYHITNKKYLDQIMKIGLKPKHKNKFSAHPDRIYLTKTIEDAENIKFQMWMDAEFKNYDIVDNRAKLTNEYVILTIDTNLLSNLVLRKDINYDKGFYITTNIPPSAISLAKELL